MTDSLNERIMDDLVGLLKTAAIEGIGQRVYDLDEADVAQLVYPAIVVSDQDDEEDDGAFEAAIAWFPSIVAVVDTVEPQNRAAVRRLHAQRQLAYAVFRDRETLPNVTEVWDVRTRRARLNDPRLPRYQFMASAFLVRCAAVQARA